MDKILITGGAGFVGANLIQKLIKKNYSLYILIRKNENLWRINSIKNKIHIYENILNNKEKLTLLLKKIRPKYIYHLATYGAYPKQQNLNNMIQINIKGTVNLLSASCDIDYKKMIVTGSSSEYGKKIKPMQESDFLEPNNFYAAAKAAQTYFCQAFSYTFNKPINILRLFNIYGPYEEKGRLVCSVIKSALEGSPISLATGKEARDFTYVDDVSDAIIKSSAKKLPLGAIYNVGTGKQSTILDLAKEVVKITKSNSKINLNVYPGRKWDTTHWIADIKSIKKDVGWSPKHSLSEGLKKTIIWYKNNEY